MTAVRAPVPLPDEFVLITEDPSIRYMANQLCHWRERVCWQCGHLQGVVYGFTMRRDYHWCQRETGRHFVIWEIQ